MIILDAALRERERAGRPVTVAIVGAGYMGRNIALQLLRGLPGLRLVAVASRSQADAVSVLHRCGAPDVTEAGSVEALEAAISAGKLAAAADSSVVCAAAGIDVLVECTGQIDAGARVAVDAIAQRKHIVLVNAELDATVGPILKAHADRAGVAISNTDGDEPAVAVNLFRYVRSIGCTPRMLGNIKGFLDVRRTPATQASFAESVGQKAQTITSYADGTKLSFELAVAGNGTGFGVAKPGAVGYRCDHVRELSTLLDAEALPADGGLVDYVLGAEPGSGAFVVATDGEPAAAPAMSYFKMGPGPLYTFYQPWHLPQREAPLTAARLALFRDAAVTPLGAPVCEVVAVAKRDVQAGETLDGIGGFLTYGVVYDAGEARRERLLPMGLAEGSVVQRRVTMDTPLTDEDVQLPESRFVDTLRAEQDATFPL